MQTQTATLTINVSSPVNAVDTSDPRVTVSATAILTPDDTIPIPQSGNRIVVSAGQTLTWSLVDDTQYDAVLVYGTLRFARNLDTRMRATTVIVFPGGTLDMGTVSEPVVARCELIFNDVPLDAVNDPEQYWNGLLCLGTFSAQGLASTSWLRLASEPRTGNIALTTSSPVLGWQVGDRLILPDTRHLLDSERWQNFMPQWERPTVASVSADGKGITLTSPLQFDHPAAYNADGGLEKMPHVGNLSRNLVIRSENVNGVRGHVMFTRRAWVDISGVQFGGLGRTKLGPLDATNRVGRYPVHFHHCYGPVTVPTGYPQFRVRDCAIFCPLDPMPYKWGLVFHDSHYGEIKNNVLFNWAGAGIVGETGGEFKNIVDGNFVVGIRGNTNPRNNDGGDGSAYWFNNFDNFIRNNVAASTQGEIQGIVSGSGFNLFVPPAVPAYDRQAPAFPGADTSVDYVWVNRLAQPMLEFRNNESYGCMATGLTLWALGSGTQARSSIDQFTSWHCWEEGYFGYPCYRVDFNDFTDIGHARGLGNLSGGYGFTSGDYLAVDINLNRPRITNKRFGIVQTTAFQGTLTINDADLQCSETCLDFPLLQAPGSRWTFGPVRVDINRPRFRAFPGKTPTKIARTYPAWPYNTGASNYVALQQVFVTDMEGVVGDSFQVFMAQQAADFIVPQTTYYGPDYDGDGMPDWIDSTGCPVAGLTNAQAWAQYGVAVCGEVMPPGAITGV